MVLSYQLKPHYFLFSIPCIILFTALSIMRWQCLFSDHQLEGFPLLSGIGGTTVRSVRVRGLDGPLAGGVWSKSSHPVPSIIFDIVTFFNHKIVNFILSGARGGFSTHTSLSPGVCFPQVFIHPWYGCGVGGLLPYSRWSFLPRLVKQSIAVRVCKVWDGYVFITFTIDYGAPNKSFVWFGLTEPVASN